MVTDQLPPEVELQFEPRVDINQVDHYTYDSLAREWFAVLYSGQCVRLTGVETVH